MSEGKGAEMLSVAALKTSKASCEEYQSLLCVCGYEVFKYKDRTCRYLNLWFLVKLIVVNLRVAFSAFSAFFQQITMHVNII